MTATTCTAKPFIQSLNLCCQSHSILFQFLLKEFLATLREVQSIEHVAKEMEHSLYDQCADPRKWDDYLAHLYKAIYRLTGEQVMNEPHFPWNPDKGCLYKLHHYCYLFAHLCPDHKKETSEMNSCVRKAFLSSMESREVILCLQQDTDAHRAILNESSALPPLLDRLIDNLTRVSRLLLPLIRYYRDNENVLFFLLNHCEEFDRLYQSSCLVQLLDQMFPGGASEAKEFLIQRYAQRGFHHLLATISQKMASLGG